MSSTPDRLPATGGPDLAGRLVDLAGALRAHGVAVGTTEVTDAAAVVTALGLDDRERLRAGLAAAYLRRAGDRGLFDQLFDIHFPRAVGDHARTWRPDADLLPRERARLIRDDLATALAQDDAVALDALAARTLDELGGLADRATLAGWSAQQALDALNPQNAVVAALTRARDGGDTPGGSGEGSAGSGGAGGGAGGSDPSNGRFTDRIDRDEIRARVAAFRRRVETEARRRNAELRGTERISRYAVRPPLDRRDFLLTGSTEAAELRAVIAPLSRRLAARLSVRQRRAQRGRIDVRRTVRASISTGGVPVRPAYERRTRNRSDLVLLCDTSSSVIGFSRFTMLLMQGLAGQFRRLRVFGFINVCDEITDIIVGSAHGEDVRAEVARTARMARYHGNSDYGTALADFTERYLDVLTPRSTLLVLGDARTNGTDPRVGELRTIRDHARHVAWLNPEPAGRWGTGDSEALRYSEVVDMHECRNVEQLRWFVTRALPV